MTEKTKELLMEWAWAGVTLVVGVILTLMIAAIVRRALKKTKLEPLLQNFITSTVKVICYIVVIILALEKVGVNPSSFLTVMGVTGAAVALAVKDTLANIAGGLMIIASRPFKQGDYINVDGNGGYVERINILRTALKTYDNKEIEIPNSIINSSILTNYTSRDIRRVDVDISVEMGSDLRKVESILMEVAKAAPMVIDEPEPFFGVRSVSDGEVAIDFFVWCRTEEYWDTYYYVNETTQMALTEAGIEVKPRMMEVKLKK